MDFRRQRSSRPFKKRSESRNSSLKGSWRRRMSPYRNQNFRDSFSRSNSPKLISHQNRYDDHILNSRKEIDKFVDYRDRSCLLHTQNFGFENDIDRRDRSASSERYSGYRDRSPLSDKDSKVNFQRYDDCRVGRSNSASFGLFGNYAEIQREQHQSLDFSGGFYRRDACQRGESNFMDRELGIHEQSRKNSREVRKKLSMAFSQLSNTRKNLRLPLSICKFYNNEGTCKRGKTCEYLHVCKYFIKNDCKFGNGCMRSHNVLDIQPRAILERNGIFHGNYNRTNQSHVRDITRLVKEKLDKQAVKPHADKSRNHLTIHKNDTQPDANEQSFSSLTDRESDNGSISDEKSDDFLNENEFLSTLTSHGTSKTGQNETCHTISEENFIPLERKPDVNTTAAPVVKRIKLNEKEKSKKRLRKRRYLLMTLGETFDGIQHTDNKTVSKPFQTTITFNFPEPFGKFQVRKDNGQWQISTKCGKWSNLHTESNRVIEDVYTSVTTTNEILDRLIKEEKQCNT